MNIVKTLLELSFLFILFQITKQDFSERKISAFLVVLTGLLSIFIILISENFQLLLHQFSLNLIFIIIQLSFLGLYFRFRHPGQKLIDNNIGIGDILFLVSLTPLLPFLPFVFLYIFSLLLAIIYYLLKNFNSKTNSQTGIPLAGIMAIPVPFVYIAVHSGYSISHISYFNFLL